LLQLASDVLSVFVVIHHDVLKRAVPERAGELVRRELPGHVGCRLVSGVVEVQILDAALVPRPTIRGVEITGRYGEARFGCSNGLANRSSTVFRNAFLRITILH